MTLSMNSSTVDMTRGPLLKKLVVYYIPVVLSVISQLLFSHCGLDRGGQFHRLQGVGSVQRIRVCVGAYHHIVYGVIGGGKCGGGSGYGRAKNGNFQETVHTSTALSLVLGIVMMCLGMLYSDFLLRLLGTTEDILPQAKTYLWFIFLGVPGSIVYNFSAAILRALGDTQRPMIFILIAGVLNLALNVLLVAGFHMGVEGVAIATSLSETVSAALVI